ncbi:MAG: hypothetical protein AAB433_03815 [Nitrospirota bacterium]
MHMQRKRVGVLFSLLFTLVLAACSGGGGNSDAPVVPAGTAEGQWTGTMDGRDFAGVVLDNDTYWFWYHEAVNPLNAAGALQGQWDSSTQNGTFASLNGKAFRNDTGDIDLVPVTGLYVMQQKLDGEVTFNPNPTGTSTFTSAFDSEYNEPPDIASVAGTYTGSVSASSQISPGGLYAYTIEVFSPSGDITVVATQVPPAGNTSKIELGCNYTGTLIPRTHGNVYNITLLPSSTALTCTVEQLTGVVFFDTNPAPTKIYLLVLNGSSSRAFPFTGTKQ